MDENGLKGLEEERRLAYVGLTRARKRAYVSHVGNRRMYGNWVSSIPSRFVDELPENNIETSADQGLYAGRSNHWDSSGFSGGFGASSFEPQKRGWDTSQRGASYAPSRRMESTVTFQRGFRVSHDKFGEGTIVNVDGHKLDIQFDAGGVKRVMDSFVALAE